MPPALTALVLVAVAAACLGGVHAGVMAVGKLQTCVNDGTVSASRRELGLGTHAGAGGGRRPRLTWRHRPPQKTQTPATSLSCEQEIIVTVNLENNKLYQTEQLNFGVSCVNRLAPCSFLHFRGRVTSHNSRSEVDATVPRRPGRWPHRPAAPNAARTPAGASAPPMPVPTPAPSPLAAPPGCAPAPATTPRMPTVRAATCTRTSASPPPSRPSTPRTRSPTASPSTAGPQRCVQWAYMQPCVAGEDACTKIDGNSPRIMLHCSTLRSRWRCRTSSWAAPAATARTTPARPAGSPTSAAAPYCEVAL